MRPIITVLFCMIAIALTASVGRANCLDPLCTVTGCWYYNNTVVTSDQNCKDSATEYTNEIQCPGGTEAFCTPNVEATQKTKYSLSGSLSWEKWAGLTAGYESEKTDIVKCDAGNKKGTGNCPDCTTVTTKNCCVEYYIKKRVLTKQMDGNCGMCALWDFGQCDCPNPSFACKIQTYSGTLVTTLNGHCGTCDPATPACGAL